MSFDDLRTNVGHLDVVLFKGTLEVRFPVIEFSAILL